MEITFSSAVLEVRLSLRWDHFQGGGSLIFWIYVRGYLRPRNTYPIVQRPIVRILSKHKQSHRTKW